MQLLSKVNDVSQMYELCLIAEVLRS